MSAGNDWRADLDESYASNLLLVLEYGYAAAFGFLATIAVSDRFTLAERQHLVERVNAALDAFHAAGGDLPVHGRMPA